MRIRLTGGPFDGRTAASSLGETDAGFLVFDERGNEVGLAGDGSRPIHSPEFRVALKVGSSPADPARVFRAIYRRTEREDDGGIEVWEYVDDPTDGVPLID